MPSKIKIRFWNRLAIVIILACSLGLPSYLLIGDVQEHLAYQHSVEDRCNNAARRNGEDMSNPALATCIEKFGSESNWKRWIGRDFPLNFSIVFALLSGMYVLIWGAVSIARWIWKGRSISE